VGRRQRQRSRSGGKLSAPVAEYPGLDESVLVLRGALSPASRREYAAVIRSGLDREDAWQRGVEFLFERLAVRWEIAGLAITSQKELLGRYRMASEAERLFVRESLRSHVAERFPELEAP
jgi:hypothetical protein